MESPDQNTPKAPETSWYINSLIASERPVTIFLSNGVKLSGIIARMDETGGHVRTLVLERDGIDQLVFAGHIATIMPSGPVEVRR